MEPGIEFSFGIKLEISKTILECTVHTPALNSFTDLNSENKAL